MRWYTMSKQSELGRGPDALVHYEQTVRAGEVMPSSGPAAMTSADWAPGRPLDPLALPPRRLDSLLPGPWH